MVERERHAVPAQILSQRLARWIHSVHDRCRSERAGRQRLAQGTEGQQGAGQLPQPVRVRTEREKDGLQVIPVSEVAAKDEFFNIKNVTRDDIMAAHRVPPQLMGIIPNNTGGFGDAGKAVQVFYHHEVVPLQERFKELNQWLGEEVVTFKPYEMALTEK